MIRVLFSVLAVVAALLAIVLKEPLLYAAAAVMLLIVFILWLSLLRRRHRATTKTYSISTKAPPQPEENLKTLGIMEIRPKEPTKKLKSDQDDHVAPLNTPTPIATPSVPADESAAITPAEPEAETPVSTDAMDETRPISEATPESDEITSMPANPPPTPLKEFVVRSAEATDLKANGVKTPAASPYDKAVLGPYLQALQAALGAHTVCVLKQEEVALDYHVIALINEDGTVQTGRVFSAKAPLLTANMARHAVTVRQIGHDDLPQSSLGYSATPEVIGQVALAPAPRRLDPDVYFLLADTPETDRLNQPHARTLLAQFARLLGTLLDVPASEASPLKTVSTPSGTGDPLRPRREIIADEMDLARARNQALALALIYLNRAETIAVSGEEAIAEAERALKVRLQQAAWNGRVVRFGELTYGVFYDGDLPGVEAWGAQIQNTLSQETGLLEGGVSIGIALLQERHQTPDAFRADATEALREAYETGTCTILE